VKAYSYFRVFFALLFSLVFFSSCSTRSPNSKAPRKYSFFDAFFSADSYSRVFDNYTEEKQVHSEFEPVMTAYITYWSPELQKAYTREMARQYQLTDAAEKKIAEDQKLEDENYFVFILSASTREPEWNDFEKKNSMWRVFIENSDKSIQVDPEKIEATSPKDERAKYFYKTMSTFGKTYRIRFPKKTLENSKGIRLHITGPRGSLEYNFDVEPQQP
jgi:hypothetical protein